MHPFEILLTDKLPGTCLVAPYLAELSCDAERGAGGGSVSFSAGKSRRV